MAAPEICILGIDPGKTGALAFYFPSHADRVSVEDMPLVDKRLDANALYAKIQQLQPTHAIVELVGTRPGQGIVSAFNFGEGCGVVRGVIAACAIPVIYVTPAKWKRHFNLSKDKELSRRTAIQLFPKTAASFARVKDDGRAEAALLARYFAETNLSLRFVGEAA